MHPIPEHSTDIAYSTQPLYKMVEMAKALNVTGINVISKTCMEPQRLLFHSCVNNIQARLKNGPWKESVQGGLIADRADAIYDLSLAEYKAAIQETAPDMERKFAMLNEFMNGLAPEEALPWDVDAFDKRWDALDLNRFPFRWQRKAIETYRLVRTNIASGIYTPGEGWDALQAAHWWGKRNLEYKHYRDLSRTIVNQKLDVGFAPSTFLEYKPTQDRVTMIVTSAMGGGKSWFTHEHLDRLPRGQRNNYILHDADYMKLAFARSAIRDGKITSYTGPEVHHESSNALYENTIKRHYLAQRDGLAPEVIINSTIAGKFEIEDGLEGGGRIDIHHISINLDDALNATAERAKHLGRIPDPEAVARSVRLSSQNLLTLCETYSGKPIQIALYERTRDKPELFGRIDLAKHTVTITDTNAFFRLSAHAALDTNIVHAQQTYITRLQKAGMRIDCVSHEVPSQPFWSLSANGNLELADGIKFNHQQQIVLKPLANPVTQGRLPCISH